MRRISLYLGICIAIFNLSVTAALSEVCRELMNEGEELDPKPKIIHWYYDPSVDHCQPFFYKGLGGTRNRFGNETHCLQTCSDSYAVKFPEGDAVCNLQKERGDCAVNILKWYYDKDTGNCETFLFSGCHGNGNQFETKKTCRSLCAAFGQGRFNVNEEETEIQQRDEGDTVAIVFGCLFGIAVIAVVAIFVVRRKKHNSQRSKSKGTTEVEMQ
ncbi:kunitz-type U19-barytoxin-Tl1a [Mustelus asterias]